MSIFTGTTFVNDADLEPHPNRHPSDMYDDACHLLDSMHDLEPLDYIKWLMLIGYTEDAAKDLLEREHSEVCGTGYRIKWQGCKGCGEYSDKDLTGTWAKGSELDGHFYMVVHEDEYKYEATFETYGEARQYIHDYAPIMQKQRDKQFLRMVYADKVLGNKTK